MRLGWEGNKKVSKITVRDIKVGLRWQENKITEIKLEKLGITGNTEGKNPFLEYRKSNISSRLRYFKFRLLHGDIYSKERMFKFKMADSDKCDHCSLVENTRHLIWECPRAKRVWESVRRVVNVYDRDEVLNYECVFFGMTTGNTVLNSLITAITRLIISKDRKEHIPIPLLTTAIVSHCLMNIDAKNKVRDEWIRLLHIVQGLN